MNSFPKLAPTRLKGAKLQKLRADCWRRDHGRCVKCNTSTNPLAPHEWDNSYHMSHIHGKRNGDFLGNVECLCGSCHRRFHACGPSMEKPCPSKSK
jgi:5-methylcytosine-specific restriction endonuclease McrA